MKYRNLQTASTTLTVLGLVTIGLGMFYAILTGSYEMTIVGYILLTVGDFIEKARLHCVIEDLERENHSSRNSSNNSEI